MTAQTRSAHFRTPARRGSFLVGCLGVLAGLIVLLVIGGYIAYKKLPPYLAEQARQAATQVINDSNLSDEQKQGIIAHIDDVTDDFKSGKISYQELFKVGEALAQSPLIPLGAAFATYKTYIEPSALTPEEKANAQFQMQRLARGVIEESIPLTEVEDAIDQIAMRTGEHNWQFKDPDLVTEADLREMIAKVTAKADAAEIPVEPYEVDIAAEVGKAINEALGREVVESPAPQPLPERTEGPSGPSEPLPPPPAEAPLPGGAPPGGG